MDRANIGILLRADLLGAAGHEEGIALFALYVLLAAIGIGEQVSFGDGCATCKNPPNSVARWVRFPS